MRVAVAERDLLALAHMKIIGAYIIHGGIDDNLSQGLTVMSPSGGKSVESTGFIVCLMAHSTAGESSIVKHKQTRLPLPNRPRGY